MSRPSTPSSKRGSKPGGRASLPSHTPRDTLEVRPSWLEPDAKGPPPLQGAAADRDTLDVRPSWLEGEAEENDDEGAPERSSTASEKNEKEKAKSKAEAAPKKASRTSFPMRRGRPSLDPAWGEAAPLSEPGRSALPPPLPTTTAAPETGPASKRAKKKT